MKLKEGYKRELQLVMLDMMKDIDKLCQENDIEYYIAYGSCIGAVRHKGFIPWDDDFDIMMTDDNYFKFLRMCEEKLDKSKYYVQTPDKEEKYYLSFSKIRNIKTTLIEEKNSDIDITYGVYIDVFPLVGVPNNKFKRSILKINRAFMLSSNINVINNRFLKLIFNIILKIFGRKRILKFTTKQCFKHKCDKCDRVVSICDGDGFEINEIDKDVLGKPKYVPFEDINLPIPEDAHTYLTKIYDDYMVIPTKKEIKEKEHTPYFLDLNLSYEEYIMRKKSKTKLLFIIWSFTYGGGAERVLATLVNSLPKDKYDIDILEYWHSNIGKEEINTNVHLLDPVVDSIKENKISKLTKLLLLYFYPSILRKKYIQKKYDVEISYNYMIPTFLLRNKGKTIAWIHGDIYDLLDNKFKYIMQKRALKRVERIVAISEKTHKSITEVYPEFEKKALIINNSYDFDKIINKSNEFELPEDSSKKILYIGRYDDNKNPLYLIEVLNKIKNTNFKATFIGKGDLKESMLSLVKDYKLTKKVEILDYQKNPYPYIRNADIIACCSKSEGFPTVFVEGMVLGKPFITTNVGGAKELSNDGKCGLIADDMNDYKEKLELMIKDDKMYKSMSLECKKFVKKYSCKNQAQTVDKLIDEVLAGDIDEKKKN